MITSKIFALALSSALLVLLAGGSLHAQSPQPVPIPQQHAPPTAAAEAEAGPTPEERIAALKALTIDNGTVTQVQPDDSPTVKSHDGRSTTHNVPPRTIVKLLLQPAKGSNINVEIWLPDPGKWNNRLLGIGNGGSAGRINPTSLAWPLTSGYAAATTDMGTAPNPDSGIGNKEVWKDFGYRATHLMTLAAKKVIAAYYGKGPQFSYFNGGSTGGQQALQEAQRYPEDYDGIIAAIPAHCRTPLHAYFLWNDQILKKCPITKEQETHIIAAGNEYMAARETPPVASKFVSDPRCTSTDIDAVIALARTKDPTLTDAHAEALRKLFDGPRHSVTGARIFNGIPFGSSIHAAHGHLYLFKWVFGAGKKLEDINFGSDIDTYTAALAPYLNAENPDLSSFHKRGGKIIMTVGSADSIVPYHASLDYYERVIQHNNGSVENTQTYFRFYIIPGMGHGGGPGITSTPNLLELVKTWRETGTAPEALQGRRITNGKTELEIPLYPYPSKAGWDPQTQRHIPTPAPRAGVEPVSPSFLPPAATE